MGGGSGMGGAGLLLRSRAGVASAGVLYSWQPATKTGSAQAGSAAWRAHSNLSQSRAATFTSYHLAYTRHTLLRLHSSLFSKMLPLS